MPIWWRLRASGQALENDQELALEALPELIDQLEGKMKQAAKKLDFETANLRDRVNSYVSSWSIKKLV